MNPFPERKASIPPIEYPSELPITAHREELLRLIAQHRVLVVCGETGSGKSTQLPKLLLESGFGIRGMIGHTQPRRLAARSIAARLGEELQTSGDARVAYKIRFGDQTAPETLVKLMTDGILLAETQSDRDLKAYDAIIVDEAHERSLNIDFLLGYLRRLLDRRPDFRLIITSATIDAERFAEHFSIDGVPAPVMKVEGRGYPVEIRYLPWNEDDDAGEWDRYDLTRHVIEGIASLAKERPGDILVFLPTERDIREVSHSVAGYYKNQGRANQVDLLPLYSRLPQSEQQRIFHPSGSRLRVVFATNVAESSLTVPGIKYVIDSGTARISRYSPRSRVQRLPIEPVSRASCDQRSGRCGRVSPGICVRLYSQQDYESREAFTTPEIRRSNLAAVVLQSLSLNLGSLDEFPFIDPPRPDTVRQGYLTLRELGAVDEFDRLTEIGRKLGRLPVDPRVGRMILGGIEFGVLPEILVIAAAIETQDPRDRPPDRKEAADKAHAQFVHPKSDFLSYLKLWKYYQECRESFSRSKLDRTLRNQFISVQRMREWADVYRQLKEIAHGLESGRGRRRHKPNAADRGQAKGMPDGQKSGESHGGIRFSDDAQQVVEPERYTAIHQALLTGLLSGIAMAGDRTEYTGARGLKLSLWPGSGVFESKPKWVVAAELVETTKQYARTVAMIRPDWIEPVAGNLLKRHHSEPHWDAKAGAAFCYEQMTLFGLPIVTRRRRTLAPIDPQTAREFLIEEGLVNGDMTTNARFVKFNHDLITAISDLAARTRRRELVVDSLKVSEFYHSRLPEFIVDRARLEKYDTQYPPPPRVRSKIGATDVLDQLARENSKNAVPKEANSKGAASDPEHPEGFPSPYMRPDDLVTIDDAPQSAESFPDELVIGETRLPLEYRFEPGSQADGIGLTIPAAALSQVSEDRLGWLVPGLLEAKVISIIKSLPKRIRRNLVPAADVAKRVLGTLSPKYGQVAFMPTLLEALSKEAEMPITAGDLEEDKVEGHFKFLIKVVDDKGAEVARSRDLGELQKTLGVAAVAVVTQEVGDESWQRAGMKDFDLQELPPQVVRNRGGVRVALFPGLVDRGESVDTAAFPDQAAADRSTRQALVRLFSIKQRKELRTQVRYLPEFESSKLRLASILPAAEFEMALIDLLARRAFVEDRPIVRTRDEYDVASLQPQRKVSEAVCEVATWLPALAQAYHQARAAWEALPRGGQSPMLQDIQAQVVGLTFKGFMASVPWTWLKHYPRYFKAIAYRIERGRSDPARRDAEATQQVRQLWTQWLAAKGLQQATPVSLADFEFRWMVEELRVSLFAQPLGTSVKVSPQRCEKMLKEG